MLGQPGVALGALEFREVAGEDGQVAFRRDGLGVFAREQEIDRAGRR
jgi:hypothetical protein